MQKQTHKLIRIYYPCQYSKKVSPSQRFRLELFEKHLLKDDISIDFFPFISEKHFPLIHSKGNSFFKVYIVCFGFFKRIFELFIISKYDLIFIQREATPVGPPIFEFLYSKVFRKKIIYDFDDAIWLNQNENYSNIFGFLKCFWKIKYLIKYATKVLAGNQYLTDYALKYNKNVGLFPTIVDNKTQFNFSVNQSTNKIYCAWTGSFSTLEYLKEIIPTLNNVYKIQPFTLVIICNKIPDFDFPELEFVKWDTTTEIEALKKCQIGLMPLPINNWSKGKCGFKIIQYMALGMVPIATNIEANANILENGKSGYLIDKINDWETILLELFNDENKRIAIAHAAKNTIDTRFDITQQSIYFSSIFKSAIQEGK